MKKLFHNPGIYLFLMFWWITLFFFFTLISYPFVNNIRSFLPFFVAVIVISIASFLLNFLNVKLAFWSRIQSCKRFLFLSFCYAVTTIIILLLTVLMDYFGLICYFGGDAAGSFGMFYIPSILLYAIAGSILCLIMRVIERIRKKNSADK